MTKPKTLDQFRAEKERAETQLAQEQHMSRPTIMTNTILIWTRSSTIPMC